MSWAIVDSSTGVQVFASLDGGGWRVAQCRCVALASNYDVRFGQQVRIEHEGDNGPCAFGETGRIQLITGVAAKKREIRASHD